MTKVNVLFADEFEDVDIIIVPENIASNIEKITQQFFNWIGKHDNKKHFEKLNESGLTCVSIGTQEFIWWLNNYVIHSAPYSYIYEKHTVLCPDYPTAEF